jgi:peptidoglycan/xylan/chitin deacetylase (PgdA/CDA1 family)
MRGGKVVAVVGSAALCAVLSTACATRLVTRTLNRFEPRVSYFVPTSEPIVALTIDDGPDPESTPAILEVLERHGAHATFFVIGDRIAGNEPLLTRIRGGGHELANHSFRERASIFLSDQELARELERTHQALLPYGPVRWFRPGSGFYSDAMVSTAQAQGYRTALADVFPYDAWIPSSGFHAWYVLQTVQPGSIIVLHDSNGRGERTASTLDIVLPELTARGYRVVTLSELAGP